MFYELRRLNHEEKWMEVHHRHSITYIVPFKALACPIYNVPTMPCVCTKTLYNSLSGRIQRTLSPNRTQALQMSASLTRAFHQQNPLVNT